MKIIVRFALLSFAVCICLNSAIAESTLIFAVTLIRHGDRTPILKLKNSPHTWKIGTGELTALGMNQHNELGQQMRARYVDRFKLLEPVYVNNSLFVRSTDFNRTIQSAQSFISGLYPLGLGPKLKNGNPALPAAYQPIPVRTLPVPQDNLLLAHDAHIKIFHEMCDKFVYSQKSWIDKNGEYKDKFFEWSKLFGMPINKLSDLGGIGDNINVRVRNGVELPKGLSKKDADTLVYLANWIQGQQFKPKQIGDYFGSEFLKVILADIEKATEDKEQYKYILYSGHDSSILPVLSALGVPLELNPPYASHVDFELYKDGNEFYVEVRFNGNSLVLPGAENSKCSLENFKKITEEAEAGKEELENPLKKAA